MTVRFQKNEPQQARLKVSVYGPPGSGKTFTTLLIAEGIAKLRQRRIAYLDTERGTEFYQMAVPQRRVHPDAFDIDTLHTRSLSDATDAIKNLDPAVHGVIVLDSITHLWEAAQEAYTGKKTKIDTIPFQAWAAIKRPYKALIAWLIASPFDVFILGRQRSLFEESDDGQMKKVGVAMKAESDTPYEPHICLRLEAQRNPSDPNGSVYLCHVEKDRSGVLAGKVILNANFQSVEPLLSLLGDVQAPAEDDEERAAKDSELLQADADKQAVKAEKSRNLLADLQGKLLSAQTVEDLGKVGAEVKKQRRYLLEEHAEALRQVFSARRDQLVNSLAPEVA